jgi:predicted  nucleic acid-binding Zn-ribbon protein
VNSANEAYQEIKKKHSAIESEHSEMKEKMESYKIQLSELDASIGKLTAKQDTLDR